jgi:hypothetical protein
MEDYTQRVGEGIERFLGPHLLSSLSSDKPPSPNLSLGKRKIIALGRIRMAQHQLKSEADIVTLLQVVELIQDSAKQLINEWSKPSISGEKTTNLSDALPSQGVYEAQRRLISATGKITELVADPSSRLIEFSTQYFETRALHIAAELRIADHLSASSNGLGVKALSEKVGIEEKKLCMPSSWFHILHSILSCIQDA